MKITWVFAVAMSLLAGGTTCPGAAQPHDLGDQIQARLEAFHQDYRFPGATVAFALPDGTVNDAVVGLADVEVEADTAMTQNTRMLAASIGKTFVGALVLALEWEGVLSRQDRLADYLSEVPWFPRLPNHTDITIGHLLNHSAGLPDHVHMQGVGKNMVERGLAGDFEPQHAIAFVLDTPSLFKAGTGWAYTDTGYLVLGLVIEAATGQNYFDLVRERFLDPLKLADTVPSTEPTLAGLAVGYTVKDNPFGLPARTMDDRGNLLWNPAVEWTGGGFVTTSHDLATWGHALFTGSALPAPYLDRLLDGVSVHHDAPGTIYGSGVAIYAQTELGPVYGHGGWLPGYVSSLRHYADYGVTIAFQINTDVGIVDDSTGLVPALEHAMAELITGTIHDDHAAAGQYIYCSSHIGARRN